MPWEHCGETILDTESCSCGMSKDVWTLEFELTRTFTVQRTKGARFVLYAGQDEDDPIEGQAFVVEPVVEEGAEEAADGAQPSRGETDELGSASVRLPPCETYRLRLPGFRVEDLLSADPEPVGEAVEEEGDLVLTCTPGRRQRVFLEPQIVLHFQRLGEPQAGVAYRLVMDGEETRGELDEQGDLRLAGVTEACECEVWIGDEADEDDPADYYRIQLKGLQPAAEPLGVQQRLNNLGFHVGREDGDLGPASRCRLKQLQRAHGLEETGQSDRVTLGKLLELHKG